MIKGRTDVVVVAEEGSNELGGILTERDFINKLPLEAGAARATTIAEIMTPASSITSAHTGRTLQQCVASMRSLKVRHMPVLEEGEVKRVVTVSEVCRELSTTLTRRDFDYEANVTVADLRADVSTPGLSRSLPPSASVSEAIERMRVSKFGATIVLAEPGGRNFGIFTERDYVHNVLPFEERVPSEIALREVGVFASPDAGASAAVLQTISADPAHADIYRPPQLTCVQRETPLRDCLTLMLGHGLVYVPVIEEEEPVDVISMRDVMLFLAQEKAEEA